MTQTQEERMKAIEEGKIAQLVNGHLRVVSAEQQQKLLEVAVSEYRGGTLTTERLWGLVGALSTLQELKERVLSVIQRGQQAQQKEMRDGTR